MAKQSNSKKEVAQVIQEIYRNEIQSPILNSIPLFNFKLILLILIFSIISGFLAGIVGHGIINYYSPYQLAGDNGNQQQSANKNVLDLNFLLTEQDSAYNEVLPQLRSQIVGFYKAKKAGGIFESLYLDGDFLGSGIVATSDGWLITHQSVLSGYDDVVAVSYDKKIYPLKQRVADSFAGLVMVKIEANNLSPVKFADISALPATQGVIAARYSIQNHGSDLIKTYVRKFAYHDQIKSSDFLLTTEKIDHYLKLSALLDSIYSGSAIFNDKNEVVGLMFTSGKDKLDLAVPAFYLRSAVSNLLSSSNKILRSSLGVNYVDLSEALGLASDVSEGRKFGAVVLGDAKRSVPAVIAHSAAEGAGLEAGDIVLKVNNEEINERNSLTKLIQDYAPGKEISLTIVRKGIEQAIKVTLGEL